MATCDCEKWKANFNKLDEPVVIAQIRDPSYRYEGESFSFCPWCGCSLTPTPTVTGGSATEGNAAMSWYRDDWITLGGKRLGNCVGALLGVEWTDITRAEVAKLSWCQIRSAHGIGKKSLMEIEAWMKEGGYAYSRAESRWLVTESE